MAIKQGDKLKTKRGQDVEIIYVFPEGRTDAYGNTILGLLFEEESDPESWGWTAKGEFAPGSKDHLPLRACPLDLILPAESA